MPDHPNTPYLGRLTCPRKWDHLKDRHGANELEDSAMNTGFRIAIVAIPATLMVIEVLLHRPSRSSNALEEY